MHPNNKLLATYLQHRLAKPNVVPSCLSKRCSIFLQHLRDQHLIVQFWAYHLIICWGDKNRWQPLFHIHLLHAPILLTILEAFNISLLSFPSPLNHPGLCFFKCYCISWGLRKGHGPAQHLPHRHTQHTCSNMITIFVLLSTTSITIPNILFLRLPWPILR